MSKRRNFFKHEHIRSYKGRKFRNPYFKHDQNNNSWQRILAVIIFIISFCIAFYWVFYGGLWRIQHISVQGLTTLDPAEVQETVWQDIHRQQIRFSRSDHRFFVPVNRLEKLLNAKYDFAELELQVKGDTIQILATERITEVIWRVDRSFYFLDLAGLIMRELRPPEVNTILERLHMGTSVPSDGSEIAFAPLQPTMPIIEDKSRSEVNPNQIMLSGETPLNLLAFDQAVRALSIEPTIYEIEKPNELWLTVKTAQGFDILFDGVGDPELQANSLHAVLQKPEYRDRLPEIQYIDVRLGDRVFVK